MGTTAQKLQNIIDSKADIGAAIIEKGGAEVFPNAAYDAEIEYLESTGTQYIDTGIYAGPNTRSETDIAVTFGPVSNYSLSGCSGNRHTFGREWTSSPNYSHLYFGLGMQNLDTELPLSDYTNVRHIYWIDATTAKAGVDSDNEFTLSSAGTIGTNSFTSLLLAQRQSKSRIRGSMTARLYGCRYYESGVLTRDFRPVRVGQTGCLFDRVSGQLFWNGGTGNFGLGADKRALTTRLADYGNIIRKLPCSLDSLPLEDEEATWCIFLDCDGRVAAYYNRTQTALLEALPRVPDPPFEGLVNGMWNWTLEQVRLSPLPMCIGPLYDTNDGKSWFDIEIPEDGYEWHIYVDSNNVSTYGRIDFGDGSAEENATKGLHPHIYASKGTYRVKVYATNGNQSNVSVGGNMRNLCGATENTAYPTSTKDMSCLKRAAVMFQYQATHMFADAYNLEYYIARTDNTNTSNLGMGFGQNMFSLKQITMRRNSTGIAGGGSTYPLANARSLMAVCYPPTATASGGIGSAHNGSSERVIRLPYSDRTGDIVQNAYSSNRNIRFFRVPGAQTLGTNSAFSGDLLLKRIVFPSAVSPTAINASVFQNCYRLYKIDNLSLSSVSSLGAHAFAGCRCLWRGETVSFPALTSIAQNSLNETAARKFVIGASGTTLATTSTGAFAYNYMLEALVFMGDVNVVRGSFVNACYMLKTVAFPNATTVPALDNVSAFANCPSLTQIVVPDLLYDTWKAASNWSSTTNNIVNLITKSSEAEAY